MAIALTLAWLPVEPARGADLIIFAAASLKEALDEQVGRFAGETGGNEAKVSLPADGDYAVQVYLMRSVARRGTSVKYTLTIAIAP